MRARSYSFLPICAKLLCGLMNGICGPVGILTPAARLPFFELTKQFINVLFRDSKLTMLLRESLGNINCRTTMIAHISDSPAGYMETLTMVQLASRIHRMRKKKSKVLHLYSGSLSGARCGGGHGSLVQRAKHQMLYHQYRNHLLTCG